MYRKSESETAVGQCLCVRSLCRVSPNGLHRVASSHQQDSFTPAELLLEPQQDAQQRAKDLRRRGPLNICGKPATWEVSASRTRQKHKSEVM